MSDYDPPVEEDSTEGDDGESPEVPVDLVTISEVLEWEEGLKAIGGNKL